MRSRREATPCHLARHRETCLSNGSAACHHYGRIFEDSERRAVASDLHRAQRVPARAVRNPRDIPLATRDRRQVPRREDHEVAAGLGPILAVRIREGRRPVHEREVQRDDIARCHHPKRPLTAGLPLVAPPPREHERRPDEGR
jgi:hypothetical protein